MPGSQRPRSSLASSAKDLASSSSEDERTPVLLKNPDGSMSEGVPPGYKEKNPPGGSGDASRLPYGYFSDGLVGELDAAMLQDELNFLTRRHQQIFASLMMMQLMVEIVFFVLNIANVDVSVREAKYIYPKASSSALQNAYWYIFGLELVYSIVYYSLAGLAVRFQRAKYYRWFSTCCVLGIISQLVLAYMNKFNLLIFFLRMLAYLYAKFLKSLVLSTALMPNPNRNNASGTATTTNTPAAAGGAGSDDDASTAALPPEQP